MSTIDWYGVAFNIVVNFYFYGFFWHLGWVRGYEAYTNNRLPERFRLWLAFTWPSIFLSALFGKK